MNIPPDKFVKYIKGMRGKSGSDHNDLPELKEKYEYVRWLIVHIKHSQSTTNICLLLCKRPYSVDYLFVVEQNEVSDENEEKEPSIPDEDKGKGDYKQGCSNEVVSRTVQQSPQGSSTMKMPVTNPTRKR